MRGQNHIKSEIPSHYCNNYQDYGLMVCDAV